MLGPEHAAEHAQQRRLARYGAPSAAGDPDEDGEWGDPFPIPVHGIHAALLPTGKVILWARPFRTPDNEAVAWLLDPASWQTPKRIDPPLFTDPQTGARKPANIWCSGQSHMADGQLLVTGGNLADPSENPPRAVYAGMKTVYTFNPFDETWAEQPRMGKGRWYPSQALLPDGRTVILSGLDETGAVGATNKQVELFSPPSALGGQGKITKIGDRGGAGQPPNGDLYPHLAVLPSGRTLVAGPNASDSWLLNPLGTGSGLGWTDLPAPGRRRVWGTGVLRPGGTGGSTAFTLIGGSQPNYSQNLPGDARGVPTSVTFDESKAADGWKPAPPLNRGRSHHNTVILPDKSMVTVGGGLGTSPPGPGIYGAGQWAATDEQRPVELFDPATNSWRLGAPQLESRAYHSTALLLPDGRVLSAGDDLNGGAAQDTAEIYKPPYLFKGERPRLDSAPSTTSHGASFDVKSSGPAPERAVLMAPGAVTHANDMSQRAVELAIQPRPDGARLTTPARAALGPPGYYMLFLVSDQGVPSVAKWVQLEPEDKALGRPTSASTVERAGLESGKAVDGKPDTRWSSTFADNQWWQVDLGSVRQVDKVTIDWEDAYAARYRVVTSTDGTNFSVAAEGSLDAPGPRTTSFTARSARYVRIEGVTRGTEYGFSFYDVKVRGPDDSAPSPPPPPASEHTAGKPASAKPQPVLPKPPSTVPDRSGPSIVFNARRGLRSRTVVRGRVSDSSGVKRMQVAVTSARDRRCRRWSPGRRRFGRASRRACARPAFFAARLRRSGGGYAWAARLGARLARGRYVVTLRAVDARGNVATRTGRRAAHVTVR